MRRPRLNYRRVKIHRSYTVEEVAELFGTHKNTVRAWVKAGLPTCDTKRPMLILGRELVSFLRARRVKNKKSCRPGQMYCVRCRAPKFAAGGMADYISITAMVGNLVAICPDCSSLINRRVNPAKLAQIRGNLDITFSQGGERLDEGNQPSLNSDIEEER